MEWYSSIQSIDISYDPATKLEYCELGWNSLRSITDSNSVLSSTVYTCSQIKSAIACCPNCKFACVMFPFSLDY